MHAAQAWGSEMPPGMPPPLKVRESMTTFKCVRMTSVKEVDNINEYAYVATVKTGLRIFKGVLFELQGQPEGLNRLAQQAAVDTTSNADLLPSTELRLGVGGGGGGSSGGVSSNLPALRETKKKPSERKKKKQQLQGAGRSTDPSAGPTAPAPGPADE